MTLSFRVNDRNWCDVNPTGAVLRDIFANNVALAAEHADAWFGSGAGVHVHGDAGRQDHQ